MTALLLSIGVPLSALAFVLSLVAFMRSQENLITAQELATVPDSWSDETITSALEALSAQAVANAVAEVEATIQRDTRAISSLVELQLAQRPVVTVTPEIEVIAEAPAVDPLIEGARVTKRLCASCHSVTPDGPHRVGPNLWQVSDQPAGGKSGYRYSQALMDAAASGLVWDQATMVAYLENPRSYLPGTKMTFTGIADAATRESIAQYLASLGADE